MTDDYYFVMMNGEPIQPVNSDMIMDYWTAETVKEFLEAVNPSQIFSLEKAIFIEPPKQPFLRVLE